MNKEENISLTLNEDEFIKHVSVEVMHDPVIKEALSLMPELTLFTVMMMRTTWEKMAEYSRLKQVADMVKPQNEEK